MRSRGLVVALALLLAVGATAAVILYVNGVKTDAQQGGQLVDVVVSDQDILANTNLNPLIEANHFTIAHVPADVVVKDAVTTVDELKNRTTTTAILANEQIPTSRLSGGTALAGGSLGISPGHVAVTVKLAAPEGGGGQVQRADNITIYATYSGVSLLTTSLGKLTSGHVSASAASAPKVDLPDFTVTLIPDVRVLAVTNPPVDATTGTPGTSGDVVLTLDLTPADAQNLVFAENGATVWVGLLPPGESGTQIPASTVPVDLLLGTKQ
jgi:Flp pilus assembly protein CpaB